MKRNNEAYVQRLRDEYNVEIEKLTATVAERESHIAETKAKYQDEIAAKCEALEKLRDDKEAEIIVIRFENDREKEDLLNRFDAERAELEESLKATVLKLKADFAEQLQEKTDELDFVIADRDKNLNEMEMDLEKKDQEIKDVWKTVMETTQAADEVSAKLNQRIEQLTEEVASAREELESVKLKNNQMRREFEEKINAEKMNSHDIEVQLNGEIAGLKSEVEHEKATWKDLMALESRHAAEEYDKLLESYRNLEAKEEAEHASNAGVVAQLRKEIRQLEKEKEEVQELHSKQMATLKSDQALKEQNAEKASAKYQLLIRSVLRKEEEALRNSNAPYDPLLDGENVDDSSFDQKIGEDLVSGFESLRAEILMRLRATQNQAGIHEAKKDTDFMLSLDRIRDELRRSRAKFRSKIPFMPSVEPTAGATNDKQKLSWPSPRRVISVSHTMKDKMALNDMEIARKEGEVMHEIKEWITDVEAWHNYTTLLRSSSESKDSKSP